MEVEGASECGWWMRQDRGQIRMPRMGEKGGWARGSRWLVGRTQPRKRARVPGLQMVRHCCGVVRLALPLLYRWHCTKYDTLNYLTADGGGWGEEGGGRVGFERWGKG